MNGREASRMVYHNFYGDALEIYAQDLKLRSRNTVNVLVSGGLPHPRAVSECQQTLSEMIGADGDVAVIFGDLPLDEFRKTMINDTDVYIRILDTSKGLESNTKYINTAKSLHRQSFFFRSYNLDQLKIAVEVALKKHYASLSLRQ